DCIAFGQTDKGGLYFSSVGVLRACRKLGAACPNHVVSSHLNKWNSHPEDQRFTASLPYGVLAHAPLARLRGRTTWGTCSCSGWRREPQDRCFNVLAARLSG